MGITYFTETCTGCEHQRQLHTFPGHSNSSAERTPWGRESDDPGCRVGQPKHMLPTRDGVSTVPHQGKPCPCTEFEVSV